MALLVASAIVASCGGDDLGASLDQADMGRCPDPLVIQTDGLPGPTLAALYNLTGGEGTIDPETGRFRGPLTIGLDRSEHNDGDADDGTESGEGDPAATDRPTVEIRSGGPYLGNETLFRTMVSDPSIFLTTVDTVLAIDRHERFPTTAVVTLLDIDPEILLWDPSTHDIEGWGDVSDTGAPVEHVEGSASIEFLEESDLLAFEQLEPVDEVRVERFVRSGGGVVQQGDATRDPFDYENVLAEWGRPVGSLLVHDAGWEPYPGPLTLLDSRLDDDARACLAAFVPLVQRSIVDHQRDPSPTNAFLVELRADLVSQPQLSDDGVANAAVEMGRLGLVGNGRNRTVGDFDLGRLDDLIVATAERVPSITIESGLRGEDLATNEFIDPDIGL